MNLNNERKQSYSLPNAKLNLSNRQVNIKSQQNNISERVSTLLKCNFAEFQRGYAALNQARITLELNPTQKVRK